MPAAACSQPGARLLPHALTLLARPVLLPEAEVRQRAFGRAAVERWRGLYDIDFAPLLDAALPSPTHTITEGEVGRHVAAGRPAGRADHDRSDHLQASLRCTRSRRPRRRPPGSVNAVAVTFRAELARGHLAHPRSVDVAGVELGDVGVGAGRPGARSSRVASAGALPPPGAGNGRTGSPARSIADRADRGASHVDDAAARAPYGRHGPDSVRPATADGARRHGDRRQPWEWCVGGLAAGR